MIPMAWMCALNRALWRRSQEASQPLVCIPSSCFEMVGWDVMGMKRKSQVERGVQGMNLTTRTPSTLIFHIYKSLHMLLLPSGVPTVAGTG